MPEAVIEVIKPTFIGLTNKALIQRLGCLIGGAMQSQNEAFNAMIWNMWPKLQGFAGAAVMKLPAHLAAACFVARNRDWAAVTASLSILAHVAQSCCMQAARMPKSRSSTRLTVYHGLHAPYQQ